MKTKFVEFGGERYEVPAGSNPRSIAVAQRMQKALRAAEKPAEAPSRSSGGGGSRNTSSASRTSPRPSASTRMEQGRIDAIGRRIDKGREARSMDPRGSQQIRYSGIGADMKPAQSNTLKVPTTAPKSTSAPSADKTPSRPSAETNPRAASVGYMGTSRDSDTKPSADTRSVTEKQLSQYPKIPSSVLAKLSATQKRTLASNGSVTFEGKRYSR